MKKITVGRDSGCDIVISDPDYVVSRVHAEITLSGATWFYKDMSTNGTVINGRRVHNEEISIEHGTSVLFAGKIPLVWESVDAILLPPAATSISTTRSSAKGPSNAYLQSIDFKEMLFSFKGRINRSTFWTYTLAMAVVQFIIYGFYFMIMKVASSDFTSFTVVTSLLVLLALLFVWPGLALSVKRCHDRNKSGWFHLVSLVPLLGIWYIVEIFFLKGSDGYNQYGEEPVYNPALTQYTVIAAVLSLLSYLYCMWQYLDYLQNMVPRLSL